MRPPLRVTSPRGRRWQTSLEPRQCPENCWLSASDASCRRGRARRRAVAVGEIAATLRRQRITVARRFRRRRRDDAVGEIAVTAAQ